MGSAQRDLEVMGDFAGSAAVIVAAMVIATTGWEQAGSGPSDPPPQPEC